jgi:hypothetical protein
MIPIKENASKLTLVSGAGDKSGVLMEMHKSTKPSLKGFWGLLLCFLMGVAAAVILLYSIF